MTSLCMLLTPIHVVLLQSVFSRLYRASASVKGWAHEQEHQSFKFLGFDSEKTVTSICWHPRLDGASQPRSIPLSFFILSLHFST